jgi:hypothetical protein
MRSCLYAFAFTCIVTWVAGKVATAGEFKLEPGFTLLFNGKNLDGWKARGGEALDGKTEAFKGRFRIADGAIVIDYKMKGNAVIDTVKEFGKDLHIKFEFRPDKACNNDFYLRGLKFDIVPNQIKNLKVDEWNELEIIVKGDKVEYKCNGETARTNAAKAGATPFGIRAEFGAIELRHIRAKEGS